MNPVLKRQLDRWYPLKDIPEQLRLINEVVRFKVVPAGRRSGKTERAKRKVAKEAMKNGGQLLFLAAPTREQVKKIYWDDMKELTLSSSHPKRPSESDLKIFMPNGTEIHLIGLDKPERIEGVPWDGGVVDEIADIKGHAWEAHILPALNTVDPRRPDYRAWCWLIGVPDGLNHYYDMARYAQSGQDPEWSYYHWKSSEILPDDVIDSLKRQMSTKQFNVELNASFETVEGLVYPDYDRDLNHTNMTLTKADELLETEAALHIGMDFNVNKMSAVVHVIYDNRPFAISEFMGLRDTPSMIKAINDRYPGRTIMVYPDASGGSNDTRNAGTTDISLLEDHFIVIAEAANPRIKDRVNSVNAMICNAAEERRYRINSEACPMTVDALERQLWGKDGKPDKQHDKDHPNDALGYFIYSRYPIEQTASSTSKTRM